METRNESVGFDGGIQRIRPAREIFSRRVLGKAPLDTTCGTRGSQQKPKTLTKVEKSRETLLTTALL